MLRVVSPPIIRSTYNCIYSIWYLSYRYCYLPLSWRSWKAVPTPPRKRQIAVTVLQVPDAADTVVSAPDDGWKYHPKHVQQFPEINKLCNVASRWIYIRIHNPVFSYRTVYMRFILNKFLKKVITVVGLVLDETVTPYLTKCGQQDIKLRFQSNAG